MWKKKHFFNILKVTEERSSDTELEPDPEPLVRGTDPRIRIQIRTKMAQIGTDPQHWFFDITALFLRSNFLTDLAENSW